MKTLVYHGPDKLALADKPTPIIQTPTDAIVRITKTTICGTDLHIMKGDVPTVTEGRTLGHEGVGIIEQVGGNVSNFRVGARVLISCISSCGKCTNCKNGMYSHCENGGGWILGNRIDGTQAEYVRVPFADNSLYPIPAGADEEALVMLSDILPTGFECGVRNGRVKPGDMVAIVGAGPIGLAALLTAQFYSPAEIIMVICQAIVAAGGHIANIGVHGKPVQLNLDKLWAYNITLTTGLVNTVGSSRVTVGPFLHSELRAAGTRQRSSA